MKGQKGDRGRRGATGDRGPRGEKGNIGLPGPQVKNKIMYVTLLESLMVG